MRRYLAILLLIVVTFSCKGQTDAEPERSVGGPCQDCQAVMDFKVLNLRPTPTDTLPGFFENDPKIQLSGTVFKKDGKTPAADVLLYVYHVDRNGIYQPSEKPVGWESRHGQYRGWLKTGADGKFAFYTFRPAPYPEVGEPQHIHIYVKEPNTVPYYLDSYLFESDPLLTDEKKSSPKNRGGSGIVQLRLKDGIWTAKRDVILGLNIPDYE